MGFFEKRRAKRDAENRQRQDAAYQQAVADWEGEVEELRLMLDTVQTFRGFSPEEMTSGGEGVPIAPKRGERIFMIVSGIGLVESRKGRGHYQGGYSGFSFRIMKGVRYHTGGSRGQFIPGEEKPTMIDNGTATVTDRRVVFQGAKATREWAYPKLIGIEHDSALPMTMIHVSNRQKPSGLWYGEEASENVRFRLSLATAVFAETVDAMTSSLKKELAEMESQRPAARPGLTGGTTGTS